MDELVRGSRVITRASLLLLCGVLTRGEVVPGNKVGGYGS